MPCHFVDACPLPGHRTEQLPLGAHAEGVDSREKRTVVDAGHVGHPPPEHRLRPGFQPGACPVGVCDTTVVVNMVLMRDPSSFAGGLAPFQNEGRCQEPYWGVE